MFHQVNKRLQPLRSSPAVILGRHPKSPPFCCKLYLSLSLSLSREVAWNSAPYNYADQ